MLYQKIFTYEKPYSIGVGQFGEFPEHRHADFECNFCLDGEFDIVIDRKNYHVTSGCTTVIPPMCSHAVPAQTSERHVVTLIFGMSLLKSEFEEFSKAVTEPTILDLNSPELVGVRDMFWECVQMLRASKAGDALLVTGNVYKISAGLFRALSRGEKTEMANSDFRKVKEVEKALELIYYRYKEPITVESAAELTGYSKSSFCKIFKTVVGESFHQALNHCRVNNAAGLLKFSNMSVADVAAEVGFSEAKAFCRVFKSIYGVSPGEYKKSK